MGLRSLTEFVANFNNPQRLRELSLADFQIDEVSFDRRQGERAIELRCDSESCLTVS